MKLLSVKWESVQASFVLDEIARNTKVNVNWKIVPFTKNRTHDQLIIDDNILSGCSLIRLFHVELNGFLTNTDPESNSEYNRKGKILYYLSKIL